jgi:hypothetical protein
MKNGFFRKWEPKMRISAHTKKGMKHMVGAKLFLHCCQQPFRQQVLGVKNKLALTILLMLRVFLRNVLVPRRRNSPK